jgi:tetratricopeptide (TPR) repeat protein
MPDQKEYAEFNFFYYGNEEAVEETLGYMDQLVRGGENSTPFFLLRGEPYLGKSKFFKKIRFELARKKVDFYHNDSLDMAKGPRIDADSIEKLKKDFCVQGMNILTQDLPPFTLSLGASFFDFLKIVSPIVKVDFSKKPEPQEPSPKNPSAFGYNPVLWQTLEKMAGERLTLIHISHFENAFPPWFQFLEEYVRHAQFSNRKIIILASLNRAEEPGPIKGNSRLAAFLQRMEAAGLKKNIVFRPLAEEELKGRVNAKFSPNNFPGNFFSALHSITEGKQGSVAKIIMELMDNDKVMEDPKTLKWRLEPGWEEILKPYSLENIKEKVHDAIHKEFPGMDRDLPLDFLSMGAFMGEVFPVQPVIRLLKRGRRSLDEDSLQDFIDKALVENNFLEDLGFKGHLFESSGHDISAYRFSNPVVQSHLAARLSWNERRDYGELLGTCLEEIYPVMHEALWPVARTLFLEAANSLKASYYQSQMDWNLPEETYNLLKAELMSHIDEGNFRSREIHFNALFFLMEEKVYQWHAGTLLGIAGMLEELWEDFEDMGEYGRILYQKSSFLMQLGQMKKSLEAAQASLSIYRKAGILSGESTALSQIGEFHSLSGDYGAAMKYYEPALNIAREIGDRRNEGGILASIGEIIHSLRGDYDEAMKCYEPALNIARDIGDRHNEGIILANIGKIHSLRGDYDDAMKCYEPALNIARETGNRKSEGIRLAYIGEIHFLKGDYDKAMKCYEPALDIAREVGDMPSEKTIIELMEKAKKNEEDVKQPD